MKKKDLLILLLILLLIIGVMSYIFILDNNGDKMNNTSYNNNSTNLQLNKSLDKNISLDNEDNNGDENLSKGHYNLPSSNNNPGNNKKNSNDSYDEAMEAKLTVEKILKKNQIAGYPVYKDPYFDAWLVPIFNKETKEFVGSVFVYVGQGGSRAYSFGPESYSDYKKVISGKYDDKSDLNKHNGKDKFNPVKEEIPDYSERYVLACVNPDVVDNHLISNNSLEGSFENSQSFDLNQEYMIENNNETT